MSDELKIKKERVLKVAESCEQAKEVLVGLFPEIFDEDEEWEDITHYLKWEALSIGSKGAFIEGHDKSGPVVFIDLSRICLRFYDLGDRARDYKIEENREYFKILKRR